MEKSRIIYLADDDEDDRLLIREAIQVINENIKVIEATDGSDLLTLVEAETGDSFDVLVILDMNMPKVNGLEALTAIKNNDRIKHIPAVMISTSAEPQLIKKAYEQGVNAFIKKPCDLEGFKKIAQALQTCFLDRYR